MKKNTLTADSNTTLAGAIVAAGKLRKLFLAFLLMVFAFGSEVNAQIGGDGRVYLDNLHGGTGVSTAAISAAAPVTPFAVAKSKNRVQYLIHRTDIQNYFKASGKITHIGFNVS